jgi:hypothetical protein
MAGIDELEIEIKDLVQLQSETPIRSTGDPYGDILGPLNEVRRPVAKRLSSSASSSSTLNNLMPVNEPANDLITAEEETVTQTVQTQQIQTMFRQLDDSAFFVPLGSSNDDSTHFLPNNSSSTMTNRALHDDSTHFLPNNSSSTMTNRALHDDSGRPPVSRALHDESAHFPTNGSSVSDWSQYSGSGPFSTNGSAINPRATFQSPSTFRDDEGRIFIPVESSTVRDDNARNLF